MAYSIELLIHSQLFYKGAWAKLPAVVDILARSTIMLIFIMSILSADLNIMPTCQCINQIKTNKGLLVAVILLVTISTDQYTKVLANRLLEASDQISFINGMLQFSLIQNHGGFLGIVNNLPENTRLFFLNTCVSLLLISSLAYLFVYKKRTTRFDSLLAIITGGGTTSPQWRSYRFFKHRDRKFSNRYIELS